MADPVAVNKGNTRIAFGRIMRANRKYPLSGAMLYIPQRLTKSDNWPFKDGSIVKIEVIERTVIISEPEWWELLDWNFLNRRNRESFARLPEQLKQKIIKAGLIEV